MLLPKHDVIFNVPDARAHSEDEAVQPELLSSVSESYSLLLNSTMAAHPTPSFSDYQPSKVLPPELNITTSTPAKSPVGAALDENVDKPLHQQALTIKDSSASCEATPTLTRQAEDERFLTELTTDGPRSHPLCENVTKNVLKPTVTAQLSTETSIEMNMADIGDEGYHLQAIATQDLSLIRDRWLYPVFSGQITTCHPDEPTVQLYGQILETYPRMMSRKNQLPPIIHPWQVSQKSIPLPLANCFTLVRMWEDRVNGAEKLAEETVGREMERLFHEYRLYNEVELLAAVQVLLLYAIMAHSSSNSSNPNPLVNETTIMNIQQVAYRLATTGLVAEPEKKHIRPEWEEWLLMSAKRRTVLVLYCFDCVFRIMNNMLIFPCDELRFMPAPAGKVLSQAQTREQWESVYNHWLGKMG